jgi:hypothetical protein
MIAVRMVQPVTIMTNINYRSAPRIRQIARRLFAPGITNRTVTSVFPMVTIVTSYMHAANEGIHHADNRYVLHDERQCARKSRRAYADDSDVLGSSYIPPS